MTEIHMERTIYFQSLPTGLKHGTTFQSNMHLGRTFGSDNELYHTTKALKAPRAEMDLNEIKILTFVLYYIHNCYIVSKPCIVADIMMGMVSELSKTPLSRCIFENQDEPADFYC
jgi:hypothetical protein